MLAALAGCFALVAVLVSLVCQPAWADDASSSVSDPSSAPTTSSSPVSTSSSPAPSSPDPVDDPSSGSASSGGSSDGSGSVPASDPSSDSTPSSGDSSGGSASSSDDPSSDSTLRRASRRTVRAPCRRVTPRAIRPRRPVIRRAARTPRPTAAPTPPTCRRRPSRTAQLTAACRQPQATRQATRRATRWTARPRGPSRRWAGFPMRAARLPAARPRERPMGPEGNRPVRAIRQGARPTERGMWSSRRFPASPSSPVRPLPAQPIRPGRPSRAPATSLVGLQPASRRPLPRAWEPDAAGPGVSAAVPFGGGDFAAARRAGHHDTPRFRRLLDRLASPDHLARGDPRALRP